jgi:hypothetical protein
MLVMSLYRGVDRQPVLFAIVFALAAYLSMPSATCCPKPCSGGFRTGFA